MSKCKDECADHVQELLKQIEQLQAELDKHRWIPVGERLPKANDKYAVTDLKIWWSSYWGVNGEKGWEFGEENEWYPIHSRTITHWKPIILPEQVMAKD